MKKFLNIPNYKIIDASFMLDIKLSTFILICGCIIFIAGIVIMCCFVHLLHEVTKSHKTKDGRQVKDIITPKLKTILAIAGTTLVLITPLIFGGSYLYYTAYTHGLEKTDETELSIKDMMSSIELSPKESELPDDLTGCIIIYYRFNCDGCESIYSELSEMTKNTTNVYWVSSRSEQGLKLREKYPIQEVPSAIYIPYTYNEDETDYIYRTLAYATDEEIKFLPDEFQKLLTLKLQKY